MAINIPWRGIARAAALTIAILLVVAAAGFVSLSYAPGRWLAHSLIDGREIDGIGEVRVEGLRGDLLSEFSIDRVVVTDASGVWLEAENLTLRWQPFALLNRSVRIERAIIEHIAMARTPEPSANPSQGGDINLPAIYLSEARIDRLDLAEGIAGPAASLQAQGQIQLETGRAGEVVLSILRLDAPGDSIDGRFEILADGRIEGHFDAVGAAGGPLATMAQMPEEDIHLSAELGGTREAGDGHFSVELSGRELSTGQMSWSDNTWQVDSAVHPGNWASLPETLAPLLLQGEIQAHGRISRFAVEYARLEAETLFVEFSPNADGRWTLALETNGGALSQLSQGQLSAQRLRFDGIADLSDGYSLDGLIAVTQLAASDASFGTVDGPLQLHYDNDQLTLAARLALSDPALGESQFDALLGDAAQLDLALTADLETNRYEVTSASLIAAHLTIEADGVYATEGNQIAFNAHAALDDIARLTGRASGPVTAVITSSRNSQFVLSVDGSAITTDADLAPLIEDLSVTATLNLEQNGWSVPAIEVRTTSLSIEAEAHGASGADWQASGDMAFSGALEGSALSFVGGLATGFQLDSVAGLINARTVTASEAITLGDRRLDAPRLAINAQYGGSNLTIDWTLAGRQAGNDLLLGGSANQRGADWTMALRDSQYGSAVIEADATIEHDRLTLSLLAGTQARWSVSLEYNAAIDALLSGDLDTRIGVRDAVIDTVIVTDAQISLAGPMSELTLEASLSGLAGVPFELDLPGTINVTERGLRAELRPSGNLGANSWRATEPIVAMVDGPDRALGGQIEFGGGHLGAHWLQSAEDASLDVLVDALPIGLLVDLAGLPEVTGMINASASLQQSGGVWRGMANLIASELSAASLSDAPDMAIETRLTLDENARIEATASGGGLNARTFLTRTGVTTDLLAILDGPQAQITGGIEADGEIQSFTALGLPIGTTLSGIAGVDLTISGTRTNPEVDGEVALHDGRFSAAETGTDIVDIQIETQIHNSAIELESFSAGDGQSGQMSATATGQVTARGPRGQADISFENFTAVRHPDLTARMTGQTRLVLGDDGLLVSGETRLDRVYAQPPASGAAAIPEIEVEELNLPKNQVRASRTRLPVRLDYRVYATDQIYFNSPNFNTEWRADIRVTGQAKKPTVTGSATLVRGSATAFSRRFTLEEGEILFNGAPTDARVSLIAQYQRDDFQATVTVSGALMSPTITLSSDPTLPEDEIIARLLFNRSASELGPFEAAQLAAQLSGQDLLGFVGRFRELVGIDRLDVGAASDGSLSVTGGRRFGNDFYVEVESAGAAALSAARVEWSLTPSLSILSRLSADTEASVSIRWRRDY